MILLFATHLAATWALTGLIWTIHRVHYPLFNRVGARTFAAYHAGHTRRITQIVAPLMALELFSALGLLFVGWRNPWFLASLPLLAFNWASTWLVHLPLHRHLTSGFSPGHHQRLLLANRWRTIAWTLRGLLLLMAWIGPGLNQNSPLSYFPVLVKECGADGTPTFEQPHAAHSTPHRV